MAFSALTAVLSCAALFMSCSGNKAGYEIDGTTSEMDHGTIYLCEYVGKSYLVRDSASIENGKFHFTGSLAMPAAYSLTTDTTRRRQAVFFLENVPMKITIANNGIGIEAEGSTVNDFYVANLVAAMDGSLDLDSLAAANPTSPVVPYFMQRYYSWRLTLDELKDVRAKFDKSLDTATPVQEADKLIARLMSVQVGAIAPDFELPDTAGMKVSLSSMRGSYVLLDFWASWCPDCRKENPEMVQLHKTFAPRGLKIVGVSLDKNRDNWMAAISKDGLAWTHLSDLAYWESPVAEAYAVKWIPQSYLIDPEGTIIARSLTTDSLSVILDKTLPRQ